MENLEESNLTTGSVCVQWQQPYMCYNGLDSFQYHVSVEAIDVYETNTVTIGETNTVTIGETSHCFPLIPVGVTW